MDSTNPSPQRLSLGKRAKRIFRVVARGATDEQWAEWLRVPLEHAAAAGDSDLFNEILDAGANASSRWWNGCHGRSLLEAASRGGSVEVVSAVVTAVLESGAQADMDLALHTASEWGNEAAGRRLIVAGADVNLRHSVHQSTALHNAVRRGCEQLVNDLLQAGALVGTQQEDEYCRTSLHIAAGKGHDGIVSALLRSGDIVDRPDAYGNSPLIWAAKGGHLVVVETLLAAGADVSVEGCVQGFLGSSALSFAAELGHLEPMKAIIGAGADVSGVYDSGPVEGAPALHCATSRGQVGAIDTLVKAGADVDELDNHGRTPLLRGAEESGFNAMRSLLEHGADVNAEGQGGKTALHLVCRFKHDGFGAAVAYLLLKGADETAVSHDGKIPADFLGMALPMSPFGHPAEIQWVEELLARAPTDRAWRRRGWLVLLRAREEQARSLKCRKVGGDDTAPSFSNDGPGGSGSDARHAGAEEDRVLSGVVAMLVRRAPEGVFRTVFGFL